MTASLDRAVEAAVVVLLKVRPMLVPEDDADRALLAEFDAALQGLAALPHLGVDRDRATAAAFREVAACSYAQDGVAGELFAAVRSRAAAIIDNKQESSDAR